MKRDTRHGSSEPSSSSNNSPRPEFATVWKKPLGSISGGSGGVIKDERGGSVSVPMSAAPPSTPSISIPALSKSAQTSPKSSSPPPSAARNNGSGQRPAAGGTPPPPPPPPPEPVSEEELLKSGIALAHRLSTAEISQRQFNWDDDEDEDQWRKELQSLVAPMIRKQHEQQEQERQQQQQLQQQQLQQKQQQLQQLQQQNKPRALLTGATTLGGSPSSHHPSLNKGSGDSSSNSTPGPSLAPWSNAGSAAAQTNIVPIGEQIKELSERKHKEQQLRQHKQTNIPHYNYRLSDNQSFFNNNNHDPRYGGPPGDDGRYRYHDYERRYRSDVPPPRQELYNANNGNFEPAPMRPPSGPRIHHNIDEEGAGSSRRRPSFERSRSPMHKLTPPPMQSSRRRSSVDKYPGLEPRRLSVGGPGESRGRGISPNRNYYGSGGGVPGSGPVVGPVAGHSPAPRRLSAVSSSSSTSQNKSILEEQEEIMRQTRERARKRKEEELEKEKEREQHAKMRAEELAKKMEEKEKSKKEEKALKKDLTESTSNTKTINDENHELLAERHVLKSLDSIINDDNDKHEEKPIKTNKLWDNNTRTSSTGSPTQPDKVAWNFTPTTSSSAPTTATTTTATSGSNTGENRNNLWGPIRSSSSGSTSRFSSGIYPRDSKANGLFDDNSTFLTNQRQDKVASRRIIQRDQPFTKWSDNHGTHSGNNSSSSNNGSWRSVSAGSSIDTTSPTTNTIPAGNTTVPQSQSTPLSPVTTTSSFGTHDTTPNGSAAREMSRFFPIAQQESSFTSDGLLLSSPNTTTSHNNSLSPASYLTRSSSSGEDLFNGYCERGTNILNAQSSPPRVVFPNLREDSFRHTPPSLDSIQAVQTSIAAKLGQKMRSTVGGPTSTGSTTISSTTTTTSSFPIPEPPIICFIPAEEAKNIKIPPLLRENPKVVAKDENEATSSSSGLQTQSYDEPLNESLISPPTVKLGSTTATITYNIQDEDDLFPTVAIPKIEFSTSAYYRDSYGYVHRREFEGDESATTKYTYIKIPGHETITISKYFGNVRNYNGRHTYYNRGGWSRPTASRRIVR